MPPPAAPLTVPVLRRTATIGFTSRVSTLVPESSPTPFMRFVIIPFALLLIPAFIAGHWWFFETKQAPDLMDEISHRLEASGIKGSKVSRQTLDLSVSGFASSPDALEAVESTLLRGTPFHLSPETNGIVATATLDARVDGDTLHVSGWLPDEATRTDVVNRFSQIRPDLTLSSDDLRVSGRIALIDPETGTVVPIDSWITPLIDSILAPATLTIERQDDTIVVSGLLPEGGLTKALLDAVAESPFHWKIQSDRLKSSAYVQDKPFDQPTPLAAFVRSYFGTAAPGSFVLGPDGQPRLSGAATRALEAEWLTLLRSVTGAAKVHTDFTYLPSIYHASDRHLRSPLAPDFIDTLRDELEAITITFPRGSKQIQPDEATKLAALSSVLLTAGPALRLVVGGYPDPDGLASVERTIARLRAEAVVSFLLEMGIPTTYIEPMAFETTTDGSAAGTVEILIQ